MSSNKLIYDCDYTYYKNKQNKNKLEYLLSPDKYYNLNENTINRGIVGGTNIGVPSKNLVDIESELKGVNRIASKSAFNGLPNENNYNSVLVQPGVNAGKNLKNINMFDYTNLLLPENK